MRDRIDTDITRCASNPGASANVPVERENRRSAFDPWLVQQLVCPRDKQRLVLGANSLMCSAHHEYPIVDGIAVLLLAEAKQTHPAASQSLQAVRESIGCPLPQQRLPQSFVDAFVQREIAGTNGIMYRSLIGNLREYPIPTLLLSPPDREAALFLDLGCGWGRWCIAAHRKGYRPIGIDVSLEAARAAYRISEQLGIEAHFVVADVRFLPFCDDLFDVVFSYSVLQHLGAVDAGAAGMEGGRVLKPGGQAVIQMANALGIRSLYHQLRRGFRPARDFEVRYWRPDVLRSTFAELIGPTQVSADGYFSLNSQQSEAHMLPRRFRWVIAASEMLRRMSMRGLPITWLADSLCMTSVKNPK